MSSLIQWLRSTITLNAPELQTKVITSLVVIVVLWVLHRVVGALVWRRTEDVHVRYRWRKTSASVAAILGLFVLGHMWLWAKGFQSVATFLGLLSAGLAIALKDIVANLAGWAFIIWRRPFQIGDRVETGGHAGDVIDIRIFEFTLLEIGNWVSADQSTGRIIHVPNSKVLSEVLANYSRGFQYIWNEVPVLVTFESAWEKAKEILQHIGTKHAEHLTQEAQKQVREAARRYLIFYPTLTPTVYTSVRDSGVLLTIRYLCEPRRRRSSEQAIWEDILREFAKCADIEFAYPTRRFYDNRLEGKVDAEGQERENGQE